MIAHLVYFAAPLGSSISFKFAIYYRLLDKSFDAATPFFYRDMLHCFANAYLKEADQHASPTCHIRRGQATLTFTIYRKFRQIIRSYNIINNRRRDYLYF